MGEAYKQPQKIVAYIGLGSNLDQPAEQIKSASLAVAVLPDVEVIALSSLYHSPPMGPQDQPDYVNAVMAIATAMEPVVLLHELQTIESEHGRIRVCRWGARTLDLDLLLYGDRQLETPDLIVPHPGLAERAFVLYPLYEIAPNLMVPGKGKLEKLLANCSNDGLIRLD
ncbi:MAG: 2-amino-4-hydroxy-6-hydroxymethyldihydropteridine diphosphokinase [Methylococcaceae bacterium]|jgi:2-amino-4-hydroxy-6-hydroxymethyldihydropteridine diphosphokinase